MKRIAWIVALVLLTGCTLSYTEIGIPVPETDALEIGLREALQDRRRRLNPPAFAPDRSPVEVPERFWDELQTRELNALCNWTLFRLESDRQMAFHFLNEEVLVDVAERCLKRDDGRGWEKTQDPLLELGRGGLRVRLDHAVEERRIGVRAGHVDDRLRDVGLPAGMVRGMWRQA